MGSFKVFLTSLRVVEINQMHENISNHKNRFIIFLTCKAFLGAQAGMLVCKMLLMRPWLQETKEVKILFSLTILLYFC